MQSVHLITLPVDDNSFVGIEWESGSKCMIINTTEGQQYRYALADQGRLVRLTVKQSLNDSFETISVEIARV